MSVTGTGTEFSPGTLRILPVELLHGPCYKIASCVVPALLYIRI